MTRIIKARLGARHARSRIRRYLACLIASVLFAFAFPAALQATDQARVESNLIVPDTVYVGQKLTLQVELMGVGQFSGSPRFDLPQVSGVLVLKMEPRPVLDSKTEAGVTWVVQRHTFAVFAQRPGQVTIPDFPVRYGIKAFFNAETVEHTLETAAHQFNAVMPPGAEELNTIISARNLTVKEQWQPEPGEEAKMGDAFTRTLTFAAPDLPAMAFPPLPVLEAPGLGVYPKSPIVRDTAVRGDFRGERVDAVTYVCEQPGEIHIPALVFQWWDLDTNELKRVELPAHRFTVIQPAVSDAGGIAGSKGTNWWLVGLVIALHCIGISCWKFRKQLKTLYIDWRTRRAQREAAYFKRLLKACDQNDAARCYHALMAWLDKRYSPSQAMTLAEFFETIPDPDLERELNVLENALIDKSFDWKGASLKKRLSRRMPGIKPPDSKKRLLPALNPPGNC